MKKNKSNKWAFMWAWICFIIITLLLWGGRLVWCGTYNHLVHASSVDLDSVRWRCYQEGNSVSTGKFTSFPDGDTVSLNDDYTYQIVYSYWFTGESAPITEIENVTQVTASVGVIDSIGKVGHVYGGYIDTIGLNINEQGGIAGANIPLHVIAYDTLNDDSVSGVVITLQDASGTTKDNKITYSNGTQDFTVTAGDWTLVPDKAWYVFDDSTYTVSANDTIYVYGYLWSPSTIVTSDSDKCTLYGYVIGADGYPLQFASVEIIQAENAYDTCNNRMVVRQILRTETNSGGIWGKAVLRSKCYDSENYYTIKVTYNGVSFEKSIEVPDSASHRVTF